MFGSNKGIIQNIASVITIAISCKPCDLSCDLTRHANINHPLLCYTTGNQCFYSKHNDRRLGLIPVEDGKNRLTF